MKSKELKIKEAWITEIGEEKFKEVAGAIDDKGALNAWRFSPKSVGAIHIQIVDKGDKHYTYRPKSLQGIEDNNSWNRIDEVGLPSECGDVIVYDDGEQIDCFYWYNDECFTRTADPSIFVIPTHWRKKEQLPNPIY